MSAVPLENVEIYVKCRMGAKLTHEQCVKHQLGSPRFELEHSLPSSKIHRRYISCSLCPNWLSDEFYWENLSEDARKYYAQWKRIGEDRRRQNVLRRELGRNM